jgi:nitrogen fixation-related uncharacterized protein
MKVDKKRLLIILALVVFLVAIGCVIFWVVKNKNVTDQDNQATDIQTVEKDVPDPATPAVPEYANRAREIIAKVPQNATEADLQGVENEIRGLAGSAQTDEEAASYYIALADLYGEKELYDKGLQAALKAEEAGKTAQTAALVAFFYSRLNNPAQSVRYYQLAISRSQKTTPDKRSQYNDYSALKAEEERKL